METTKEKYMDKRGWEQLDFTLDQNYRTWYIWYTGFEYAATSGNLCEFFENQQEAYNYAKNFN